MAKYFKIAEYIMPEYIEALKIASFNIIIKQTKSWDEIIILLLFYKINKIYLFIILITIINY